jgi:hypothetical protein
MKLGFRSRAEGKQESKIADKSITYTSIYDIKNIQVWDNKKQGESGIWTHPDNFIYIVW